MTDPLVIVLFIATWGGIALIFRRLADDLRRNTVRQSAEPGTSSAADASEDMVRFTAELQQTVEELGDALSRRADRLKDLIAEADRRIESLAPAPLGSASPEAPIVDAAEYAARLAGTAGVFARPQPAAAEEIVAPASAPMDEAPSVPSASSPEVLLPEPAPAPVPSSAPTLSPVEGRASAEEVRRLAAQGMDADTIARLTNRGREEVRLLISRTPSPRL